jgi:hypothetical protein
MIVQELIGKKVVVHVETGANVAQHRGVLEAADAQFLKVKKDSETLFLCISNIIAVGAV